MRDTSFGSVFAVLGYGYQVLLLADFSARLWRPELELRWGVWQWGSASSRAVRR